MNRLEIAMGSKTGFSARFISLLIDSGNIASTMHLRLVSTTRTADRGKGK